MALPTQLLVDGCLVGADASLHVVDPGRGIPFISVPRGSRSDAAAAVNAAKKASAGWAAMPIADRQKLIAAFADSVNAHADELGRMLVQEQGKPLAEAQSEIVYAEFF
jgi:acyl-CoA reductase-like NAD-dependent aldehyde dehydrogenase